MLTARTQHSHNRILRLPDLVPHPIVRQKQTEKTEFNRMRLCFEWILLAHPEELTFCAGLVLSCATALDTSTRSAECAAQCQLQGDAWDLRYSEKLPRAPKSAEFL